MRELIQRFKNRFSTNHVAQADDEPPANVQAEIAAVQSAETGRAIELGKEIHCFRYRELELRLDRDVLGLYRVTVNEGRERRFSFTIVCEQGDYDSLSVAYSEIISFLGGDRSPAHLPRTERLKGHFYG